jgi:ankyrin repeat protein
MFDHRIAVFCGALLMTSSAFAIDELFGPSLACDPEGVASALADGADVNAVHSSTGQSAVAYAYHCIEVTRLLLDGGAKPDNGSYPALVQAASIASYDVMQALLDAGADPNIEGLGETPLYKVVQMTNCAKCARLLLDRGADIKSSGKQYTNLAGVFAAYGKPQEERKAEMVQFAGTLKGYGLEVGPWYTSPSAEINAPPGDMLKTLAEAGLDLDARTTLTTVPKNDGEPALFSAINVGHREVIQAFLDNGVDHNATYPIYNPKLFLFNVTGGYTPLMYAAATGNTWLVEELVNRPDLSNPTFSGMFMTKDKSVVKMSGISAIYLAIMSGDLEAVQLLAATPMTWSDLVLDMKGGKFDGSYGSKPAVYQVGGFKGKRKGTLRYRPSMWAEFSLQAEMAAYLSDLGL